ncbi:GatB/YqeY domain-containing protein [Methylobacterium sp. sgz302541]|uniref:GatB/YqeY domain-containing protein n=1 Tax=unclassified Methylobacterium TaxID=2615210 RepID=UPI003D32EC8E
MSLRERLTAEMKEAMKAGDKPKLGTVRMILAALKERDIEARGAGKEQIGEEDILSLLQKMIKQRTETATVYEQGGRPELAETERAEAAIVAGFLPQQMDEAETKAAIDAAIAETGAAGPKDMGKVIAVLKGKFAGRMDFGKASGLVKAALAGG